MSTALPPPDLSGSNIPVIPHESWCKNRLQEYAQKASMPLPMYETVNEGQVHETRFRSRVWVDGTCFVSPNTFSTKKMAEQDAAKHAFIGLREKVKTEGSSRILEDIVICKAIMNEYAVKMNIAPPTYLTSELKLTNEFKAPCATFVSSVLLNGVKFTGDAGRNKKEAERSAACSAISSILASEPGTAMSEIVKSKFRFFDALKMVKDPSSIQASSVAAGIMPPLDSALVSLRKTDELEVSVGAVKDSSAAIEHPVLSSYPTIQFAVSESVSEHPSDLQSKHQLFHMSKKSKIVSTSEAVNPPINFVPPASDQSLQASGVPPVCPGPGKKRKKKKAKKQVLHQSLPSNFMMPQSGFPDFSVVNQ